LIASTAHLMRATDDFDTKKYSRESELNGKSPSS
jgi:hypothetical protein